MEELLKREFEFKKIDEIIGKSITPKAS